jgi:hypothetical protein
MANWVRCTDLQGGTIFVNFDNAITLSDHKGGQSKIGFMGAEKEHVFVKESIDQIYDSIQLLENSKK